MGDTAERCHPMWMLRAHRALLLNGFRAKGQFSSGVVEGFNTKAKPTGDSGSCMSRFGSAA